MPATMLAPPPGERLDTGLVLGPRCPSRLRDLLVAGRPVLLQARASSPSGQTAYAAVAQNVRVAAQEVADSGLFPNLPGLLPTARDLATRLQQSTGVVRSHDADGHPFENRFLTLQVPGCATVWLHLSCGSGRKIDEATWHQPVALHSAAFITEIRPAIVVAAEVSRWTRRAMALAPWIDALERLETGLDGPPYVCRRAGRAEELSTAVVVSIASDAASAGEEAREMRRRTRKALRAKVPLADEGGVAIYPFSQAPPPPLATAWRSDGTGGRGAQIVFVDTPAVRDRLTGITYGLPEVFEADGTTPVCQLSIVRFFTEHRGLPEWPAMRLARHLAAMGLSTEGLRRQRRSQAASWADRPLSRHDCWRILHSLEAALEFHRTGELWRGVGDRGEPVLAVTLLPADGNGYVSPSDYARIHEHLRVNQVAHTRARHWTFGHLRASRDGVPGRLVARVDDGHVVYGWRADPDASSLPRRRGPAPMVEAQEFALSLCQGVRDHAQDLTHLVPPPPDNTASPDAERAAQLAAALTRRRRMRERLYADVFPADGVPRLHGALLHDANEHYNRLAAEIDADARALEQATLLADRARSERDPCSLAVADLMAVLVALRDPEDVTFQRQWHRAITDLRLNARVVAGGRSVETRWQATLTLGDGDDLVTVPFEGTSTRPFHRRPTVWTAEDLVARLREGVPLPGGSLCHQPPAVRAGLRAALGVPTGPMPLLTVRDPRLLRVGMAVLYPPRRPGAATGQGSDCLAGPPLRPGQLPAAARRLGEPLRLVKRVVQVTGHHEQLPGAQRMWQTPGDTAIADLFRDLQQAGGTLHRDGYDADQWSELRHAAKRCPPVSLWTFPRGSIAIRPCPWCQHVAPLLLTIREVTEPVCDHCRRDLSGILWPADPYDRYRARSTPRRRSRG